MSVEHSMKVFRETTAGGYYPNHTYILSPHKQWMYGYVPAGKSGKDVKMLKNRVRFDSRYRTFVEMKSK